MTKTESSNHDVETTTTTTSEDDVRRTAKKDHQEASSSLCDADRIGTQLLYMTHEGNFQRRCIAQVTDVRTSQSSKDKEDSPPEGSSNSGADESWSVCLNQTILHPQGGGQPTDWGWITKAIRSSDEDHGDGASNASVPQLHVTQVSLDRITGIVTHTGKFLSPPSSSEDLLRCIQVGDEVMVQVDVDRRQIMSECHTAGHVVDAALAKCGLWWKPSKAYHFLDGPYVEYQCPASLPVPERTTILQRLQDAFVELLEEDLPTNIQLLSLCEANVLCNPKTDASSEPLIDVQAWTEYGNDQVRVVTVGGYSCPCGGTHVRSTGDLKTNQWRITGLKCKGGSHGTSLVRVKYNMASSNTKKK